MCGVIGCYSPNLDFSEPFISEGLRDLAHRGPDNQSFSKNLGVTLGHTRLKIVDLSDNSNQPIISLNHKSILSFNGMIYNYKELGLSLGLNYAVSDTRVLVEMLSRFGIEALNQIDGMFAFAWIDLESHKLYLVRDRFGIKPLYYQASNDAMFFASTITPLLRVLKTRRACSQAIFEYMSNGLVDHEDYTFFEGIKRVLPGEYLEYSISSASWNTKKWYHLSAIRSNMLSRKETLDIAHNHLIRVLQTHTQSDVPTGFLLSGGLDSSLLNALGRQEISGDTDAFLIDFYEREYSEIKWANLAAKVSGINLIKEKLTFEYLMNQLDECMLIQEEPFGGVMTVGLNLLFDKAQSHGYRVILDGSGLDDVAGGYEINLFQYVAYLKRVDINKFESVMKQLVLNGYDKTRVMEIVTKLSSGFSRRDFFLDGTRNESKKFLKSDLLISESVNDSHQGMDFEEELRAGLLRFKAPRALRFKDKISMAHSIEVRVPYFDHKFVEFCHSIPYDLLFDGGQTKSIFRQVASRILPSEFAGLKKRSVQSPQNDWVTRPEFVDSLKSGLDETGELLKEFLELDLVFSYLKSGEHLNNSQNRSHLWQLMMLSKWFRIYF